MTAPAAVVSVVLSVTVLLWDEQVYSSHRWLATLLMAYLVFAQAGTDLVGATESHPHGGERGGRSCS